MGKCGVGVHVRRFVIFGIGGLGHSVNGRLGHLGIGGLRDLGTEGLADLGIWE